jgi:iron complex outermembrane recepter protein
VHARRFHTLFQDVFMHNAFVFRPRAVSRIIAATFSTTAALHVQAQVTQQQTATPQTLDPVIVTATPLARTADQLTTPASVITRQELEQLPTGSLGATLDGQLGVTSSAFAPGAGRPVIRGQDGPRVQVLENGLGVNDVSRLSADHRVSTETANAQQVEILRGPATLLYGSGAIGGLINVVNNRIPMAVPQALKGNAGLRFSDNARERNVNAALTGGAGNVAWTVDALNSRSSDYDFPGQAVEGDPESFTGTMPNSNGKSREVGAGGAWLGEGMQLGASFNSIRSQYGVPGEQAYLPLEQEKFEARAAFKLSGIISDVVVKLSNNRYEHSEVELPSNETAVTFKNKGTELRAEISHAPLAGWRGTAVVQASTRDFSALSPDGEFELVEPNKTRTAALALVETREFGAFAVDAGLRMERERHTPEVSEARSYNLTSASLGGLWKFAPGWQTALTLSSSQRAPQPEELYTNGPHEATATFEIGDPNLQRERASAIDLTLRKTQGPVRGTLSVFSQRFTNYVYTQFLDTDADGLADRVEDDGTLVPDGELLLLEYLQGKARFTGAEFEVLADIAATGLSARLFGDQVRARLNDGTPLPRISPARLGLGLRYTAGAWQLDASTTRVSAQERLAPLELRTPGYTRVDLGAQWQLKMGATQRITLYTQLRNATDEQIRLHTSVLKDSVPQPGRTWVAGAQLAW